MTRRARVSTESRPDLLDTPPRTFPFLVVNSSLDAKRLASQHLRAGSSADMKSKPLGRSIMADTLVVSGENVANTGQVDSSPVAMLSLEAMGKTRLSGVTASRRDERLGVEHVEVGSRSMASESEPCPRGCAPDSVLPAAGFAQLGGRIGRWTQSAEPPCT
jgi:hypothetical protein